MQWRGVRRLSARLSVNVLHKSLPPIGVARGEAWGPRPPKGVEKLHNRFSCAKGTNIYVKVLCLVIVHVNVTKYTEWSKKMIPQFWFCDNFRKYTPILTIFSLLEQEIYGA